MAMALLFLERMPGRQIFVALLVLPTVITPVIAGAIWRLLFDNRFGPVNQVLGWLAGEPVTILWTVNPAFVYPAILIAEVWQWTPFMFLLLLAGLSNVDQSQLEAAEIDGAGWWRIFFRITLPAIRPVLAIALLIRALDLIRLFDVVWALTKGGPGTMTETISIYAYVQGFQQFETSYTAAIAILVIVLAVGSGRPRAQTHGDRAGMSAQARSSRRFGRSRQRGHQDSRSRSRSSGGKDRAGKVAAAGDAEPGAALSGGGADHRVLPVPDLLAGA